MDEFESFTLPYQDHDFWHKIWEEEKTDWHETSVDPVLEKYVDLLDKGSSRLSVLVTMCGKSVDLLWLCNRGHSVTGVELSPIAMSQFFKENSIPHTVTKSGEFSIHTATDRDLKIYCGNIFQIGQHFMGQFDAIWDCKAIIAVNVVERVKYRDILVSALKPKGRILMTTWVYEQKINLKTPFSISHTMIRDLFGSHCDTEEIEDIDMRGTDFCKRNGFPWATRPVMLLTKKC